jgi:hypothetical protein
VPGMVGRASPDKRPALPLAVPSLLRDSAMSGRLRLGRCFAAEERRRRWPAEAWKEDWEASVTYQRSERLRGMYERRCAWLARQVRRAGIGADIEAAAQFNLKGVALQQQGAHQAMRTAGGEIQSQRQCARLHLRRKGARRAAVERRELLSSLGGCRMGDERAIPAAACKN